MDWKQIAKTQSNSFGAYYAVVWDQESGAISEFTVNDKGEMTWGYIQLPGEE